ncbi:MAG: hypothetical protein ABW170_19315 [Candidatus Thiodiazotropha sp. L084R]
MKKINHTFIYLILIPVVFTSACGGGGGGDDDGQDGGSSTTYSVTATADSDGTILPATADVANGESTSFTITPDAGFTIGTVSGCNGTLTQDTYMTGPVSQNCTVTATFISSDTSFTVTATAGSGGSIDPATATVNSGASTSFNITPDTGFNIDGVSGCNGSLTGNTYTTGSVTQDCTVSVTFADTTLPPDSDTALDHRPTRIDLDFDNNGVAEGVEIYSYDTSGRLRDMQYTYTDDSVVDQYYDGILHYEQTTSYQETYSYDDQGRIDVFEINNVYKSGSSFSFLYGDSSRSVWDYDYTGDLLEQNTQTVYNSSGAVVSRIVFTFDHDDQNRISAMYPNNDQTITPLPSPLPDSYITKFVIAYDTMSRPISVTHFNESDVQQGQQIFVWNGDEKLESNTLTFSNSSSQTGYAYTASGCVDTVTDTSFVGSDPVTIDSIQTVERDANGYATGAQYDENGNGSIEMVSEITTENESYIPPKFPDVFPDTGMLTGDLFCHP